MNKRFYISITVLLSLWLVFCITGLHNYNHVVHLLLIAAFVIAVMCYIEKRIFY